MPNKQSTGKLKLRWKDGGKTTTNNFESYFGERKQKTAKTGNNLGNKSFVFASRKRLQ